MVKKDLTGLSFGRLKVLNSAEKQRYWVCKCECGIVKSIRQDHLLSGATNSCGCLLKETRCKPKEHKRKPDSPYKSPIYRLYWDIKRRCYDKKSNSYKNYGGRGIKMYKRWLDDYLKFYEYVKPLYKEGLQIDRIDNNKGYLPNNIRFVTPSANSLNKRTTIMYHGVPLKTYCEENQISYSAVLSSFRRGHSYEYAINYLLKEKPKIEGE